MGADRPVDAGRSASLEPRTQPCPRCGRDGGGSYPGTLRASLLRAILPRSRHRPVAITDGSSKRNPNKTGVRLWPDCRRRVSERMHRSQESGFVYTRRLLAIYPSRRVPSASTKTFRLIDSPDLPPRR